LLLASFLGRTERGVLSDGDATISSHLDRGSLVQALERIISFVFLKLERSVLIQEFVDGKVSTTNSDVDLVLIHSHRDTLGTELIDTITLSHKHDLKLLSIGEVVDILSKSFVDGVALDRDVDGDAGLQVDDVLLQSLNLELSVLKVLEDVDRSLRTLEVLGFKGRNVIASSIELVLKASDLILETVVISYSNAKHFFSTKSDSALFVKASVKSLELFDGQTSLVESVLQNVDFVLHS